MKINNEPKKILILGGAGFIGGHLSKRLHEEGNIVINCDIKGNFEFWPNKRICSEHVLNADLRNLDTLEYIIDFIIKFYGKIDEIYQLAADMGGAGYIFTGFNDLDVMHNSLQINLNLVKAAKKYKDKIGKIFYSSSACMYPSHNQEDPTNPDCKESSAYPANPDSEYGWEKLFSERLYLTLNRDQEIDVRIGRFHNIFGPHGTWKGGREKAPAAMCRKVAESNDGDFIEVWGNGQQTRSFLYIDECIESVLRFMNQDSFIGPVNIGSEEMVTINELAQTVIDLSKKDLSIKNINGDEFIEKYGYPCPIGVNGRNSNNDLYREKMNWSPCLPLKEGIQKTYNWINEQV